MNLSNYSFKELIEVIKGDDIPSVKRSGQELVKLFNQHGMRDIYNYDEGGLPKLQEKQNNTSRKEYTFNRLRQLNGSTGLSNLLLQVAQETEDDNKEAVINAINIVITEEGYKLDLIGDEFVMIGIEDDEEVVEVEYSFEQIENQIIQELDDAEFTVWVAMAWFTNPTIHAKLTKIKDRGVNVRVITIDDNINQQHGCSITEFDGIRIPQNGFYGNNKMHNTFCIIDIKTVLTGSYNWSRAAEYNDENISIIRSRKVAIAYSKEFVRLRR